MNWLYKAVSSSIGKKVVMAITGLALCGFLIAHLGGNLLLYKSAESYNHYADALHAQEVLLVIAEIGLLVLFLGHLYLAWATYSDNTSARPLGYAMKQTKMDQGPMAAPPSSVMGISGMIVLLFVLLHLADFRFELRGEKIDRHAAEFELAEAKAKLDLSRDKLNELSGSTAKELEDAKSQFRDAKARVSEAQVNLYRATPYAKAIRLLKDPITWIVYVVGSIVLGYHCLHGFQSAFQSLGLNHPKYTPLIKSLSVLFAVVVGAGFASFPIWAILQN